MNYIYNLLAPLTMLVSLSTACGVLLHDTNLDKAFMSVWTSASPMNASEEAGKVKPGSTPHTHAHSVSLSDMIHDSQAHPRNAPRSTDRKHLHQKRVARGNHTFDGHRLTLDRIFS